MQDLSVPFAAETFDLAKLQGLALVPLHLCFASPGKMNRLNEIPFYCLHAWYQTNKKAFLNHYPLSPRTNLGTFLRELFFGQKEELAELKIEKHRLNASIP